MKIKRMLYSILLAVTLIFLIPLFIKIGQCEAESYGWYGENNIEGLLILSGLFLIIEVIVIGFDGFILLARKAFGQTVNNLELNHLSWAVLMFIAWISTVWAHAGNGTCDLITGPADTGLCLAMLIAAVVNIWKLKSLKKIMAKPKRSQNAV